MKSLHVLLHKAIDYAGLFPPAQLDMATAVANYARYRAGNDAWALGRFVVPVARLAEFAAEAAAWLPHANDTWRLSALAGPDLAADLAAIQNFNARWAARGALIDVLEGKATTPIEIRQITRIIGNDLTVYIEVPLASELPHLIDAIHAAGLRAKMRTGGVTADAIPAPERVLRFMELCTAADVPFKATAGLHHPLRAEQALTYAPDSPRAEMHGFLNVLLAAALLRAGAGRHLALAALEERDPVALHADDQGLGWRDQRFDLPSLQALRNHGLIAFGSCSFEKPLHDLKALHLL
ncbi:hypothetical protein [Kallotenue papyrolyticum]|uniref:hypothetical protein n=1 Tax=Kallotenue papyrolyticum TaxID=1325125 RepID=UPI000471CA02|nr:hypothetical protein [Kallotenue papyrolyticum]